MNGGQKNTHSAIKRTSSNYPPYSTAGRTSREGFYLNPSSHFNAPRVIFPHRGRHRTPGPRHLRVLISHAGARFRLLARSVQVSTVLLFQCFQEHHVLGPGSAPGPWLWTWVSLPACRSERIRKKKRGGYIYRHTESAGEDMILTQSENGLRGLENGTRGGLNHFSKVIKREVLYCDETRHGLYIANGAIKIF